MEHARDLVIVLLQKELKVRYQATVLGYFWSVLQPLAMAMVFLFAFKIVLKNNVEDYPLVLITGLFPWQWMSNSVNVGSGIFLANRSLLKRVSFPRFTLVLAAALNEMTHFFFCLPVIGVFMLWYGHRPTAEWVYLLPAAFTLQIVTAIGLMLIVATANMFFRDMERLVGLAMMLAFYLTPIIYPTDIVPENMRWIMYLNPFAGITGMWRAVFQNRPVDLWLTAASATWGVVLLTGGTLLYNRMKWRFAEVV